MSNQLTTKSFFEQSNVKEKFAQLMGKNAESFISSVLQVVNSSDYLKNADPHSIYSCAVMACVLKLSINPNLGFAYIVPYNNSYKDEKGNWQKKQVAQFQIGYKGFIQLAQRSGKFKTISATKIYEGQLVSEDPLRGYIFDFSQKKSEKIIGYAAYFSLLNGFEKTIYLTVHELQAHGKRFSKTFDKDNGLWNTDFDGMAIKTVIKLLLSKFAPLSIEMESAIQSDQAIIRDAENSDFEYIDKKPISLESENAQKENERIIDFINKSTDIEKLDEALYGIDLTSDLQALVDERKKMLKK